MCHTHKLKSNQEQQDRRGMLKVLSALVVIRTVSAWTLTGQKRRMASWHPKNPFMLLSVLRTSPSFRKIGYNRHLFSTKGDWVVPTHLSIPEEQLDMSFARSSGAGGQNVNKVNSQVLIKLPLNETCTWIPDEVRERLREQQQNRINKQGDLVLHSQEYRTQTQNRKAAVDKLRDLVLQAWPRPKVRKIRKGVSKQTKERN